MAHYLIVGGSHGIGESLVQKLKEVEITTISRGDTSEGTTHIKCDVEKDSLPEISAPLNGLVYCPGTINLKPFRQLTEEDFRHDFEINCLGAVRCIQHYLPNLKEGKQASIVLFSTVAVQRGMAFHASIAAAKGAIEGVTRSLAAELAPDIRVNCIAPSLTETPLAEPLLRARDQVEKRHPLRRLGKPEDSASAAAFLLGEESSWITGQVIGVDGGLSTLSVF